MSGTTGSVSAAGPDHEAEVLCDAGPDGTSTPFLRRYTVTATGAVTTVDTALDGTTPYTPVGEVGTCAPTPAANPQITPSVQRQTGAGTVTIPAGARSVTVLVYADTTTASIGGGAAVTLPAGTSLTWAVDQGGAGSERLADAFVFTGSGAGADFIVASTREA